MSNSLLLTQLTSMALRAVTLGCRLVLILLLAWFLPPGDVGLFGLIFVCVNFGLMLAGFSFHFFSNRETVGASDHSKSQILFNQVALYAFLYVLILPIAAMVFRAGLLPWELFGLFLTILILEHLSYESQRLFVSIGRPLIAGVVAFLRGASWALVLALLFIWREDFQTLHTVLILWSLGGLLSLLYTGIELFRTGWSFSQVSLDISWIMRGLRVALPFFIGTLAVRGVFTLDRFFIEDISNMAVVGVYTFYTGLCVALLGIIDAAIFSFFFPRLIAAANSKDKRTFFSLLQHLFLQTAVATTILATLIYLFSTPLIELLEKDIYLQYMPVLKLLLIAFSLFIFSTVPQYGLYSIKSDIAILKGSLISLLVFLASMATFYVYKPDVTAVPISMILAFCVMAIIKAIYLARESNRFFSA